MIWQSCDNLRAATLNESMAEQLSAYLAGKEIDLCRRLHRSTQLFPMLPPQLSAPTIEPIRLNDTIDDLCKRMQRLVAMPNVSISVRDWKVAVEEINTALWHYIEILEGSMTELFQQIDQIGFEQWSIDLSDAATNIKDDLIHRLDDAIWGMRRLDKNLSDCYNKVVSASTGAHTWRKFSSLWKGVLDPSLESTTKKCQKFLNFRYGKFVESYVGYLELYDTAEEPLRKTFQFRALSSLDMNAQERYKHLFLLLRLWGLNKKARTLPRSETVRAVRSLTTVEAAYQLFHDYLGTLRNAIFDKSRLLKRSFGEMLDDKSAHLIIVDQLGGFQKELRSLASTAQQYRQFLLETNVTKRTQWGLTKLLGPKETKQTRSLIALVNDCDDLDKLSQNFRESLDNEDPSRSKLTNDLVRDITHHLHEMGQPLASKVMMRRHAKVVLQGLQKIDEMASFHAEDVGFISRTLCKVMRLDWKYHVLYDIPGFQQFFQMHMHIIHSGEDRQHMHRYNTFKKVFQQIRQWIDAGDLVRHAHDVDLDISDTKSLLQDFLGHVQQSGDGQGSQKTQQLLEYLNLFGMFFHSLQNGDPDQRQLRRRFFFADQYFDAIEKGLESTP